MQAKRTPMKNCNGQYSGRFCVYHKLATSFSNERKSKGALTNCHQWFFIPSHVRGWTCRILAIVGDLLGAVTLQINSQMYRQYE